LKSSSATLERSSVVEWMPAVDIREEEKQFVLHADLPGVEAKDIDITLEKGELTIRGRRQTAARAAAWSASPASSSAVSACRRRQYFPVARQRNGTEPGTRHSP